MESTLLWFVAEWSGGKVGLHSLPRRASFAGVETVLTMSPVMNVSEYATHSMRRTKASLIYKATGNLRAVQILLGHSSIENTVRYLGVDIDDAIALAERTEI